MSKRPECCRACEKKTPLNLFYICQVKIALNVVYRFLWLFFFSFYCRQFIIYFDLYCSFCKEIYLLAPMMKVLVVCKMCERKVRFFVCLFQKISFFAVLTEKLLAIY